MKGFFFTQVLIFLLFSLVSSAQIKKEIQEGDDSWKYFPPRNEGATSDVKKSFSNSVRDADASNKEGAEQVKKGGSRDILPETLAPRSKDQKLVVDERIQQLVEKHVFINDSLPFLKGWRIQLASVSGANSKTKAREIQAKFIQEFPDIPAYLIFQSPNFKVKAGNFKTKLAALKALRSIEREFPDAFMVIDQIELPKLN